MRWAERQLAMLREMGVRLWLPPGEAAPQADQASATGPSVAQASGDVAVATRVAPAPVRAAAAAPARPLLEQPPRERAGGVDGVATLGWPALREAVAACTACALCNSRRQTVFGVGGEQAHWMVVGEAPGEQEDIQGEPFVGKSGQLLDNMLNALGLTRGAAEPAQQVYIANTLKCRPPGNRNPAPDELAQCEAFLVRQVQLLQPRIILAMGAFAVKSLLRSSEPVGKLRGRVHHYQGVPLIVTYHPAYLLRNPADKARAWDDLCLAAETVQAAASR
ncbi:MAG: uracil-DNA glycosylase [Bacteriovorax sp.]|nr:uracil-DNA glycosylase [Rhizobacter sp.]